jgi:IMP cyclohydrolase
MVAMQARKIAETTFTNHLKNNVYPGRGLVVGRQADDAAWLMVYFIMGRSENSRNRRFAKDGERLWTEPVDESKVSDPSLIIYDAMLALPKIQIVSNGDQTTTLFNTLKSGGSFSGALNTREREPDAPNFTPRISAVLDLRTEDNNIHLSVLKANRTDPAKTDRITICPANPPAGFGYGLTTYMGDGAPLPSFAGDPLLLPLNGAPAEVLTAYWDALDKDNRVALAVKQVRNDGAAGELLIRNAHD